MTLGEYAWALPKDKLDHAKSQQTQSPSSSFIMRLFSSGEFRKAEWHCPTLSTVLLSENKICGGKFLVKRFFLIYIHALKTSDESCQIHLLLSQAKKEKQKSFFFPRQRQRTPNFIQLTSINCRASKSISRVCWSNQADVPRERSTKRFTMCIEWKQKHWKNSQ